MTAADHPTHTRIFRAQHIEDKCVVKLIIVNEQPILVPRLAGKNALIASRSRAKTAHWRQLYASNYFEVDQPLLCCMAQPQLQCHVQWLCPASETKRTEQNCVLLGPAPPLSSCRWGWPSCSQTGYLSLCTTYTLKSHSSVWCRNQLSQKVASPSQCTLTAQ